MRLALRGFKGGGIHPRDEKRTALSPIRDAGVPPLAAIPLSMHAGKPAKALVKAGDRVKTGQLIGEADGFISANVHSSVTGTVARVDAVLDTNGRRNLAIQIKPEPEDDWAEGIDPSPGIVRDIAAGPEEIRELVRAAGIVGMGGAAFPTHVKLSVPEGKKLEHVLINGSECEPFLTADHRLMLERGDQMMIGIRIILKALSIPKARIGVEDNKPDAIAALAARSDRARIRSQIPSACTKSIRPFKNARLVNSPGSANRAPASSARRRIRLIPTVPPWP